MVLLLSSSYLIPSSVLNVGCYAGYTSISWLWGFLCFTFFFPHFSSDVFIDPSFSSLIMSPVVSNLLLNPQLHVLVPDGIFSPLQFCFTDSGFLLIFSSFFIHFSASSSNTYISRGSSQPLPSKELLFLGQLPSTLFLTHAHWLHGTADIQCGGYGWHIFLQLLNFPWRTDRPSGSLPSKQPLSLVPGFDSLMLLFNQSKCGHFNKSVDFVLCSWPFGGINWTPACIPFFSSCQCSCRNFCCSEGLPDAVAHSSLDLLGCISLKI